MTRADRPTTLNETASAAESAPRTAAASATHSSSARSLSDLQETASPLAGDQGQLLEQTLKSRNRRTTRQNTGRSTAKSRAAAKAGNTAVTPSNTNEPLAQIPGESEQTTAAVSDRRSITGSAEFLAAELQRRLTEHFEFLQSTLLQTLDQNFEQLRQDQSVATDASQSELQSLSAHVGALLEKTAAAASASPAGRSATTDTRSSATAKTGPETPARNTPGRKPATSATGKKPPAKSWEEIRQELFEEVERKTESGYLADLPIELPVDPAPPTGMRDAVFSPAESGYVPADFSPTDDLVLTEIPKPGELEILSAEELRTLIQQREAMMARLIYRLRCHEETRLNLLTLDQLRTMQKELPEELATLVENSIRRTDNLTRLGELELAFERARLTREKNHLQQSRQWIEMLAKQMGYTLNADGTLARQPDVPKHSSRRRWLGKLGFGHPKREK
jgi:hypothetical protein